MSPLLFYRWQTSYWGDCSRTCNGGIKRRDVRCVQRSGEGIEYEVDETLCSGSRPPNQEICNREPCPPEWVSQPFGEVSFATVKHSINQSMNMLYFDLFWLPYSPPPPTGRNLGCYYEVNRKRKNLYENEREESNLVLASVPDSLNIFFVLGAV